MSSQIASLFAKLGFSVDEKGLKEFENKLNKATKSIKAQGVAATKAEEATTKATKKTRQEQNQLAKEIRANYAKVRTDRKQAVADIRRINDELAKGNLKGNQKRELVEARGRTQQRLDDLVKQEKAARDRIHSEALRDNNKIRQRMERRDEQAHKVRTEKSREQQKQAEKAAARQARLDRQVAAERRRAAKEAAAEASRRRSLHERRDTQQHQVNTQRAKEAQKRSERLAAQQARLARQNAREKSRLQSIQERRDYESWRQRGERARQEREQERRHHQQRMREANQYGRRRNRGMSYRGAREYGRAWIPGIGGAYSAIQSTQSYQGYVGTQAGLTAATGSQEQAGEEFKFLTDLSNRLGVFIGDTTKAFTSLAANTRNTSLEGQGTRDIFEAVTSYSRVLNLSADDQNGVFRALTQMVGKGQVYAEELRQQMGERLPGSFQAMARAAGYGSDEAGVTAFYKAVEDGEIRATEVFPRFAEELMKMANEGGALEKAMNNTAAAVGRFRTNVYLANKTINESGYDKAVRNLMNRSSESIDRSTPFWELLGQAMEQVGKAVEVPIELFGALNQRLPAMLEFVKENEVMFKLLGATIVAAFAPLRNLFLLVYGVAAISDLLLDPDRERSWAEWVVQLGLAGGAFVAILATLTKIFDMGKKVTGIFRSTPLANAAGELGSGAKETAKATGKRLPIVGTALAGWEAFNLGRDVYDEFNQSRTESPREWINRRSEERGIDPSEPSNILGSLFDKIDSSFAAWVNNRNSQAIGQAPYSPEMLTSLQGGRQSQEPTRQFIGDVHISVESSDPLLAGTKVEESFMTIFNRHIRTASTSQQVTEK